MPITSGKLEFVYYYYYYHYYYYYYYNVKYLDELASTYGRESFVLQYENVVSFLTHLGTAKYRRHRQTIGFTLLDIQRQ